MGVVVGNDLFELTLVPFAAGQSGLGVRAQIPRGLNVLGIVSAVAGLITVIPGLSDVGMIFGLGSIAWFAWTGIVLLRHPTATAPVA